MSEFCTPSLNPASKLVSEINSAIHLKLRQKLELILRIYPRARRPPRRAAGRPPRQVRPNLLSNFTDERCTAAESVGSETRSPHSISLITSVEPAFDNRQAASSRTSTI